MRKTIAASVILGVVSAFPVHADQGFFGINYTLLNQDDRFFGDDSFHTGEVFVRLGGHVNRYFATELRLGTTANDEEQGVESYRFQYHAGAYASVGYRSEQARPYLLLGYTFGKEQAKLGNRITGTSKSTRSIDDLSYGAGVDIYLTPELGVNVEYVRYYDIDDVSYQGPSFGLYYRY